jgi:hypothetical protein
MKFIYSFILLVFVSSLSAQVKGKITDTKGQPIPFANIYVKDTYIGTTSNDNGNFELSLRQNGTYTLLVQYLGYKTEKQVIDFAGKPITVDFILKEEEIQLNEVVIDPKANPADAIIKNAIANRKSNSAKTSKFTCDFYSRGLFRIKNLPKTFMGQKVDFLDEVIDSTRSGILYLSETVSKLSFQKPDKMKEVILASKVSGKDNGFSFNSAAQANFDFYENYIDLNVKAISPIADNAFAYYRFKFEGSFADENNREINKIKVIPRRSSEPTFEGYIYIVEENHAIYAVDLAIKGASIQNPAMNLLTLKQNFSYNATTKVWSKNTQTLDFEAGIFGFNFNGRFTYVYSNFEFPEKFERKTFTAEVLKFEENSNKKEDAYWNTIRPVPLTSEESNDYIKKELIQTKHKSKAYLDSIDKKRNKFGLMDLIGGYSYSNSYKKRSFTYEGPMFSTSFNTVQGWKTQIGFSYNQRNEDKRTYYSIGSRFDYGFAEQKLRGSLSYIQKLENKHNSYLTFGLGSFVQQFNSSKPISENINSVSSLFFKNNFMKLYEKNTISAVYTNEITNGIRLNAQIEYSERKPLFNNSFQASVKSKDSYSSNNPLAPLDETTPAFTKYNLVKTTVSARFDFGQKYWTRPDGKFNIGNGQYPTLTLSYEKGLAGSEKRYEFDFLMARINQELELGNKGELDYNLKMGKFFNADQIAFPDFKHFNGNQTHVSGGGTYTSVFNNLPYYSASTNDAFVEFHMEHNDKGFIMNKIPLLNKINSQLVIGYHNLSVPNRAPYHEFTIGLDNLGFKKFKLFRIDYVRSYQSGFVSDAVVFGMKFLGMIE